ncbi:MAG: MaoC family dehydratase [Acidobacteriota bacterium]
MNQYLEDLSIGHVYRTIAIQVSEEEILEFARRYDPQPIHIDREAAASGPFKGLIASGWHTAALVMKLNAESKFLGDTPMLGMGVEGLEWPVPVRPGDTLRVETEVKSIRLSKSNPGFGIVSLTCTAYNQDGVVAFVARPNCWVPKRP